MTNNNYEFEEYASVGGRFTPIISLGQAGGFGVSAGFTKKYDLSKVVGVKLFYDRERAAVAFKFLTEKESGMLKFKPSDKGGGYINGKPFLIKFDIDQKKFFGKYVPKEIDMPEQGKVFVIELKEKGSSKSDV